MIIGGVTMQHPHSDLPRTYCKLHSDTGKSELRFEVNQKTYNDAMSKSHGHRSILSGFNKDGFLLSVPNCYLDKPTDDMKISAKYGKKGENFRIESTDTFKSYDGAVSEIDMTTIRVPPSGCKFAGDFMHSGANNIGKLTVHEKKKFDELFLEVSEMSSCCDAYRGLLLFNKLSLVTFLPKISRLFVRCIPKLHNNLFIPYENMHLLIENKCEYVDNIYWNKNFKNTLIAVKRKRGRPKKLTTERKNYEIENTKETTVISYKVQRFIHITKAWKAKKTYFSQNSAIEQIELLRTEVAELREQVSINVNKS